MTNTLTEQIQSYLEDNITAYMAALEQMVAINSFTANPDGINQLADLTGRLCRLAVP